MIKEILNLLGLGPKVNYAELLKQGAIILDVRSRREYANGHIKGSINIPVDQLRNNLFQLKDKTKPIITCCASGVRSASAKNNLKSLGYTQVYNGGSWGSLNYKLK
ncbi:MAG TPA: rhodanese-like domain-containing protein [Cyclobacteriaceae bacterium]|nr:rhodanese-like domain-containing protein [Cyclobacteriaceae bacterium]